jgi:uncharacterized protein (TIGR02996 family)
MSDDRLPFLAVIDASPSDTLSRLIYADFLDERFDSESASQQMLPIMLRDVLENPDDDAPRLAYADICERYGYDDRARTVRMGCESAKRWKAGGVGPSRANQHLLRQLRLEEECKFVPGGPHEIDIACRESHDRFRCDFCRGFIRVTYCTAADWLTFGQSILRCQPVEQVRLTDYEDHDIVIARRTEMISGWILEVLDGSHPSNERWYRRRSDLIDEMPARLRRWGIVELP